MKITTIACTAVVLVLLVAIVFGSTKPKVAGADSLLPQPALTGALGEGTCASCHTGAAGIGDIFLVPFNGPVEYIPGQLDTIAVSVGDPSPGQMRWGFEFTALKDSDGSMAGTIVGTPFVTASQTSGGKTYICQTSNGITIPNQTGDGTWWGQQPGAIWYIAWTAPPQGSGDVTIYASGVAADGNQAAGSTDYSYTTSLTLTEGAPTPVSTTTWGKIKKRYP